MENNEWRDSKLSAIDKEIDSITFLHENLKTTLASCKEKGAKQRIKRRLSSYKKKVELLRRLRCVVERSTRDSFIYQQHKVNREIGILESRYFEYMKNNKGRGLDERKLKNLFKRESGLDVLIKQRRNVNLILSL